MDEAKPARGGDQSSRERFLSAADDLFIAYGYDGCTIRAIAAQAGTSLASLSRNWSSKRHLFEEVFQRHFDPIHSAQQRNFDALEASGDLTVQRILTAFFDSAISRGGSAGENRRSYRVYCCALADPSTEAREITRPLVTPVRGRLIGLMRRALPDMDDQRFFLAMNVVLGAYVYPQTHGERLAGIMELDISGVDWRAAVETLAGFVSDGLSSHAR
ncbi:TetR/AcrR family transcriptional regulator [Sphingomonas canadensis]|uniref:TetR/AcrR family transcriptional regulator n=1 Tax=Sphingomonas canadensis TaxID=1219257 RepID=A0ABW3H3D5_9SPHN|nr:TetR/AcrR family transcriptional regulator [Sphingomonas canadensis]MCW3834433.1 TetR family transcriptional regulator [Sphingomonas canadensis]